MWGIYGLTARRGDRGGGGQRVEGVCAGETALSQREALVVFGVSSFRIYSDKKDEL